MTTLVFLSLLTILAYTVTMVIKEGVPYSVSDTYYSLEHKWAFSVAVMSHPTWVRGLKPSVLDTKPLFWIEVVSFINIYLIVL